MNTRLSRTALFIIAVLCLIWGSTWRVIQDGLHDLPPLHSLAARFVIAAVVLQILAPLLRRFEGGERPTRRQVIYHGWLCCAVPLSIVYVCELVIPSGLASLIWGIFPILIAGLAPLLLPVERLNARQALGFVSAFLGLCLLFATDLQDVGGSAVPIAGVLLLSPLCSAVGTLLIKRNGAGTSSVLMNRDGLSLAAVTVVAAALIFERDAEVHWTRAAIFSVCYMGICATVLAFTLYFWLLRTVRANQLALISYVTPLIALAIGYVCANERVGLRTLGGAALILVGVFASRRR